MLSVMQLMPRNRILKSKQGHHNSLFPGRLSHKIKTSFLKMLTYPHIVVACVAGGFVRERRWRVAKQDEKLPRSSSLKNTFVNVWVRVLMELEFRTLP